MKVAIHQPNYIPYPGFFAKLHLSDVFVIYDTAQFTRGSFINRNRIRTFSFNGCLWLTLPVGKRNFKDTNINNVRIPDKTIFDEHGKTLETMYSKAPFFDEEIFEVLKIPHENLAEHNTFILGYLLSRLKTNRPRIILASELGIATRHGNEGLIDILREVGGDEYISGKGAFSYIKPELFEKESIDLTFLDYKPWKYPQIHPGFVENMSLVDAILNIGWDSTAMKLKETKTEPCNVCLRGL